MKRAAPGIVLFCSVYVVLMVIGCASQGSSNVGPNATKSLLSSAKPSELASKGMLGYFAGVKSLIQSPPREESLRVVSRAQVRDVFVTFMGPEPGNALIALLTRSKPKNPEKRLFLKVRFNPMPTEGELRDWMYIFDRNPDGRLNYIAAVFGAPGVKKTDFPADYPKGTRLSLGWYFKDDILTRLGEPVGEGDTLPTNRAAFRGSDPGFGSADLAQFTDLLNLLNDAVRASGLEAGSMYADPPRL